MTHPARDQALADFYQQHKDDPNVLDKWFSVQARANRADSLDVVKTLMAHPDFTFKNPNRLRAVIGVFANANPRAFHALDGSGYKILADTVIALNSINPMTAARILTPMREWERYDDKRKALMKNELVRILNTPNLSNDVFEIVSKSLGEQYAKPALANKIGR
jgi:aminopeptidase N